MKRYKLIAISLFLSVSIIVFFFTVPIFSSGIKNELITPKKLSTVNFQYEVPLNAARCLIVIDAKTNNILFSQNAHEKRGMASTTKIMTALVAIENANPLEEFVIPKEAVGIEGSSVYLKEGEKLNLLELLYCLMLESGNDAATAIAYLVSGSVESFTDLMNQKAKELGLSNTNFKNPHGLSDEDHFTTAYDLAIITSAALKHPLFSKIVATKSTSVRYDEKENGRRLVNHNKLLFQDENVIGVKTGYTKRDGKCLVTAAENEGRKIIAVTLQDPFPTSTHKTLLDFAFNNFYNVELAKAEAINSLLPIKNGEIEFTTVKNLIKSEILLPKNSKISCEIFLPKTLYAPIENQKIVGYAIFYANEKEVYIINIETTENIIEKKKTLADWLFGE